ncbi:MAG: ParB/Srx family N-terminal domain-containing protein [Methylocella sp.]
MQNQIGFSQFFAEGEAGKHRRDLKLAICYMLISSLRLDPQNPRLHSRKQVRQIANSIASFGFNVPMLIDAERLVVAGHGRVLAAKELGRTEIPVIAIEHLDAAQRRAFAIADNRLTENSAWDDRLLAQQLKELSILDLSFDLEANGFDMGEIEVRAAMTGLRKRGHNIACYRKDSGKSSTYRIGLNAEASAA